MAARPKVWYWPTRAHTDLVFAPEVFSRMLDEFDVTITHEDRPPAPEEIMAAIGPFDAVVTGWGTPPFAAEALEHATNLKIVAHSAGSPKAVFPQELVDQYVVPRGITVFSAAGAIAFNVAESAVGMLIMTCRRWPDFITSIREAGVWRPEDVPGNGQYLQGSNVGIVAASRVGREVLRILEPWDVTMLVYDPYLSGEQAQALGAEKVELNELFERSDHVSVHAPSTTETAGMIGADQLRRLRDGAAIVNTSRGAVIDQDALYKEARGGRIMVCLDVTDPEPIPPDSPLRRLRNVYITPHVSGAGTYGYHKIGEMTLQALEDFYAGRPVRGAVDLSRYDSLA
jgi:phosphoglycerate dehydrogenase-like enzyme